MGPHLHDLITSQRLHLQIRHIWIRVSTYGFGGDTNIQSIALRIAGNHQKLEEARKGSLLQVSEGV